MIKKILILVFITLSIASCTSSKDIVYFQGDPKAKTDTASAAKESKSEFETTLKSDDVLAIIVSAPDPLIAAPFNLPVTGVQKGGEGLTSAVGQQQLQTYLVDREGNINFPVIGVIKVAGFTKEQVVANLIKELKKYINEPIVNLRIVNFKVSVLGEVARPGSFTIQGERISLAEALSLAGDMTIYGLRHEIVVLRDINGVKTYNSVDIGNPNFINSPFYYLTQNDVVYVKPNNTRVKSAAIGPNTTLIISALSLLLTTIALLTR
ncbi:polysaccharide export protein [Flavobacterium sp. Sd200]|uniref:polysaccharide biosynthesis/export family protein n=1 Tax=Flavobacterium sp. Sd200 TaxID=2692211 RepID=UPI001367EBCD|nr:polysaccharide biosynthesis/export family protein [Flavobacterium sp. Sd200]MXN91986.1 polysaccharide export protein [Flavobacterium sp. Sd200]